MVNVNGCVTLVAGLALSVTWEVKGKVPLELVVPLRTPAALKLIPEGRLPPETVHVYGAVPPVSVSDCE